MILDDRFDDPLSWNTGNTVPNIEVFKQTFETKIAE